ncbi:hypothetical protein BG000_011344 [Podila horticola]|nr:hypothetical protein BG000_011344 [Podila horticola]
MATAYLAIEPVGWLVDVRAPRRKRAVPPSTPPPTIEFVPPTTNKGIEPHQQIGGMSTDTEHILAIIAAVLGSVLLILSLILFYICMKRRRASRRISQLQEFLPTFMDHEKAESYFRNTATSTSSGSSSPKTPSNVHHRTRSAPVAFAKGGKGSMQLSKNRSDRDGSNGGQFQQIPLVPEDTPFVDSEEEAALKKSLSTAGPTRTRATTVSVPPSATVSSLHRSVSLSHHRSTDHSSRTPLTDDDDFARDHDDDALPTAGLRFAEGEMLPVSNSSSNNSISRSGGYSSSSNRYSVSMEFNNLPPRFSATSHLTHSMDFDPTRFSTTSVMFDAKRLSILSGDERGEEEDHEDDGSVSSGDDFDHLPAHQKPQNFESHTMMDMMSPLEEEEEEEEFYAHEQHGLSLSPSKIVVVPISVTHQLQQQGA